MPIPQNQPTAYAEANHLLDHFQQSLENTLGDDLSGLYLQGSLALGDFHPPSSDIDFFVVTRNPLDAQQFDALAEMHQSLEAQNLAWLPKLEGSYIPLVAIQRYDPQNRHHPRYDVDTKLHLCGHGADTVIQYHVLREKGIVLTGPASQDFMDPVPADSLREASRGILAEWWLPQIEDTHRLHRPSYESYAILTMCRILYTVSRGDVVSKPQAAQWVQSKFGTQWSAHIQQALDQRGYVCLNTVPRTIEMIAWTWQTIQQITV